jgi:hypothetical protein
MGEWPSQDVHRREYHLDFPKNTKKLGSRGTNRPLQPLRMMVLAGWWDLGFGERDAEAVLTGSAELRT